MLRLLPIFLVAVAAIYPQTTVIGGSGGGVETNDLETTITGIADGEVFKGTGADAGAYTSILTAIGEDLATANCVPFENGGSLGCDADMTFDGTSLKFTGSADFSQGLLLNDLVKISAKDGANVDFRIAFGSTQLYRYSGSSHKFYQSGVQFLEIGGTETVKIQDGTAATGDTSFIVKAGAGQSSNLQEWQNSSGTVISKINSGGDIDIGSSGKFLVNTFWRWQTANLSAYSGGNIRWSSDATASGLADLGINRGAAGVLKVTDGSTGLGYLQAGAFDLDDGGTQPTCDSSTRGYFWMDEGGAGVADSVDVCAKDSGDAYAWRTIY